MRRALLTTAIRSIPLLTSRTHVCVAPTSTTLTLSTVMTSQLSGVQRRHASHAALAEATRREMEEEQQRSGKPEKPTIPEGWTLERKPGERVFTMKKTHEDEEILLRFRGEREENEVVRHEFDVLVSCRGSALVFGLSFEGGEVVMERIAHLPEAQLARDETAEGRARREALYTGPDVGELEEGLVDAFVAYLEARGIDDRLGEFIEVYNYWAEQAEYEGWLTAVNRLVA